MFTEPADFLIENETLLSVLLSMSDKQLANPTNFKGWTATEIVRHLHVWNRAAHSSLLGTGEFTYILNNALPQLNKGQLKDFEAEYIGDVPGQALITAWQSEYSALVEAFVPANPEARLPWAGPDMSVRSSITARQMETWAHGQAIFDLLGSQREESDRIYNIVLLGIMTFGWTFRNRNTSVPATRPHVVLAAPSGAIWEFNQPNSRNSVQGSAVEFCQVVTQTRNVADTSLQVAGVCARQWMAKAQCFAGPPQEPPAPGSRPGTVQKPPLHTDLLLENKQ